MRLSLRNKIFILVAIPSIGLLALIAMLISLNYNEYSAANSAVEYVNYSNAASKLIHEWQKERGRSSMFLGNKISQDVLMEQRNNAIKAHEIFSKLVPKTEISEQINGLIKNALNSLSQARAIVDAKGSSKDAVSAFGAAISDLILSETLVAQTAQAFGEEKKLLSVVMLDIAKENAGKLRANVTNVINTDKDITVQQIEAITSLVAGVSENLSSPTLMITEKSKEAIKHFKESAEWKKANDVISTVLSLADRGNFGLNANEYFDSITVAINNLGEIIFSEQVIIKELITQNQQRLSNKLFFVVSVNLVLLLSVVVLSYFFVRSITRPIQNLTGRLNEASAEVNHTAEKVSSSAEQLSQNSTEQAAALQEAVTSFEEISQMIGKTAENAKVSQEVSKNSFEVAQNSQLIISELNGSINEISDANNKIKERVLKSNLELEDISKVISEIGQKTRIINDIVFQTKLLSFNASVEAARAGEEGKGFAVVAEEIGKLAAVSGNASQEISEVLSKSLKLVEETIGNTKREINQIMDLSKEKVDRGSQTAVKCGEALNDIVGKVQQVNTLVVEIAQACFEQSQGMSQISLAMNELDTATHSNSMTSVQTAQSGQLLNQQAQGLKEVTAELSRVINAGDV